MYERTDSTSNIESYSDAQESIQRLFLRRTLFRIDFQVITEKIQEDVFSMLLINIAPCFQNRLMSKSIL